ncbi:glucose 1-dehydrogenase [Streptomyces sp. NPDC002812]|uniref:SDR family NAD(P)-dependent oxidoreductase n=1 Tax=Streptomyces TaxID=1883 RepID=UPI00202E23B6|nr:MULTISPECIES: glucose 1-dehydrogenase [unclassified Streptomyces]MCM1974762.1 glucose 1-dehydrogenase [Streptomyces sp. G1]MCX5123804.1 glucose 1-dehydrogenase [Streptomyces sp. NBC_00347]MCX5297049.1 glucose 1-dehydrogenase [Streptomyces sp. NBC_00193]
MSESRVALITGSSSGIGAGIARRLAAAGIRVVLNSARSEDAGKALAAELPDAVYVRGDVADADDARRIVRTAIDTYGRLDILVNNAGTTRFVPLDDLEAADAAAWREIFEVNVVGTWQMITAAAPHLRESGANGTPGSIVNISSVSATRALGSSIPYAVSKAAVNHMTRLLASQLGPAVRVNAIAPGLIDTPWYEGEDQVWESSREWITQNTPLRRVGTPEDVAEAALYLVDAAYTTGDVLTVDGGRHVV